MVNPSSTQRSIPLTPDNRQERLTRRKLPLPEPNQVARQITQLILTMLEPQSLLPRIAEILGEVFQGDTCLIVARTNSMMLPQIACWQAEEQSPLLHPMQLLEHPVAEILTGAELAITDLQAGENGSAAGSYGEDLPMRAILRTSTRFQSLANGAIAIGYSEPHEWSSSEKELLEIVSEPIALAIHQIQLQEQVNIQSRRQSLMNQFSQGLKNATNAEEILQLAIRYSAEALQVDRGLVLLLKYTDPLFNSDWAKFSKGDREAQHRSGDRTSQKLPRAKAIVTGEWIAPTESLKTLLHHSFTLSESYLCQLAYQKAPQPLIQTHLDNPNPSDPISAPMSSLLIPLLGASSGSTPTHSLLLGFLVLQQHHRTWLPEEIELVNWVSAQASTAMIQTQTLRQVQALVDERTAQLQKSLEVQAKLYEKTRQQIDQLRQLNQLKDEFLDTMNHELRTPLTSMNLAIRMLRQSDLSPERRAKYLEILESQCNQEINLINDLLTLQQLEFHKPVLQPQKFNLTEAIAQLSESFDQKWADKGLKLNVKYETPNGKTVSPLILYTEPESLNRILLEVLTNAGKYSDSNTTIELGVTYSAQPLANQIVLTLCNRGPGIGEGDLPNIFDKFRRGQGVTQKAVQGTGLGLALVKCLVQHLNGTVEITSDPINSSTQWETCLTLTLPYSLT